MSDETPVSARASLTLPDAANLDWLRKQAKRRFQELQASASDAKLADAQFDLAKQYGFSSWRALKTHVDSLTIEGRLFAAARTGDVEQLRALLDAHPEKLDARAQPYAMTLLHLAAQNGHLAAIDLLLSRGLDVNSREKGDNTYAMHWAAAGGRFEIVQHLAVAGGDVIGHGDDHELEVIGWATCWDGSDDDAHRAVVDFLIRRGARHHIFSAIAMNLASEVRRIVASDPSSLTKRMSRNENHQLPLHFAVRKNRPEMVALLLELGADPAATDDAGVPPTVYAADSRVGRAVIEMLSPRGPANVFTALALGDETTAARLLEQSRGASNPGDMNAGALHLSAKRGDAHAVKWLLDHGADPNARWSHWGALVTPLHLATWQDHTDVVRLLLAAGADPTIHDSLHDSDAIGWAEYSGRSELVRLLTQWRDERPSS